MRTGQGSSLPLLSSAESEVCCRICRMSCVALRERLCHSIERENVELPPLQRHKVGRLKLCSPF